MRDSSGEQQRPAAGAKPRPGGSRRSILSSRDAASSEMTALLTVIGEEAQGGAIDYRSAGMPFLVSAARPLLDLIQHLRQMQGEPDINQLHAAVVEEMRAYERKVASGGVDAQQARVAHYALCATIDDVVLSAPWGGASAWAANSIVSTFHRDVVGGERFFDLVEHFHRDPGGSQALLLLFYFCLSLGFKGRLRVSARGALELAQIRDSLYRTLRSTLGEVEREISPHWRGVDARNAKPRFGQLYSAAMAGVLLLLVLGYVGLLRWLNGTSDSLIVAAANMPPLSAPTLKIKTVAPQPVVVVDKMKTFQEFLQPEIERGLLTTTKRDNQIIVRFRTTGFFASGDANVSPQFEELLTRVSKEIKEQGFTVLITGHTDTTPISTLRFPSNWHLSQARAKAVSDILTRQVPTDMVRYEGRGETEPVDTNDTPQGREANRRTEVIVTATPKAESAPNAGGPAASGGQP